MSKACCLFDLNCSSKTKYSLFSGEDALIKKALESSNDMHTPPTFFRAEVTRNYGDLPYVHTHLVLGPFNFNFSYPTNLMAVLEKTFHAGLNEVQVRVTIILV